MHLCTSLTESAAIQLDEMLPIRVSVWGMERTAARALHRAYDLPSAIRLGG